ncbi:uracil-DNA glycosylase [Patescibacteria group bacterium]|nr:uracil-DNA glycosylase [Patescibacteria group bacterium]MBU4057642.1 uracil-DNA glycosylase [Patescibacteria group bacterium]MBU4115898.1 uracil-DNA glycosylase [Patescibacteria group bacterium]
MREIKDEVLNLTESPLYEYRKQNNYFPVIGEGNHNAKIMFIGEAPGLNEAKTGRPFCGSAGKILDELLENVGIKREDVYIGNILKDRPQQNRDPLPAEIEIYGPFLNRQINIIQPKIIATLGRYSMDYIMRKFELETEFLPIGQMHGKVFDAKTEYGDIKIVILYHPAVAIYNNKTKDTLKEDFLILKDFI